MDIKTNADLTQILKILTKFNVKSAEIGNIKLELSPRQTRDYVKKKDLNKPIQTGFEYTQDEIALWSAGGIS